MKIDLVLPSKAFIEKRNHASTTMKIFEKTLPDVPNNTATSLGMYKRKTDQLRVLEPKVLDSLRS